MWFLVPFAILGGIILKKSNSRSDNFEEEEIPIEYSRIYICHSFCNTKSYKKIVRKLKLTENHKVSNHSIPRHKPKKVVNDDELRAAFKTQMQGCSHVFVLATSGLPRKSYVKMEIEVAKELGKKIFAIRPRGSVYVPKFIKDAKPEYISNHVKTLQKTLKK